MCVCTLGSVGGGQSVEVSGVGFSDHTKAYICGQECTTTQSGTSSSLTCNTPLAQGMNQSDTNSIICISVSMTAGQFKLPLK